jgi:Domain of unknown function (DUF5680)
MNTEALRQFLIVCNAAGYAGGDEKQWVKETDGSLTIPFARGGWRSHDNFFGGEPYGGRTVVFHDEKPVWLMAYYGWVADELDADPVYGLLRRALRQMPEELPLRGPAAYREGEFTYTNAWRGTLTRFAGEEQIARGDQLIYQASYSGGLVDQRRGV